MCQEVVVPEPAVQASATVLLPGVAAVNVGAPGAWAEAAPEKPKTAMASNNQMAMLLYQRLEKFSLIIAEFYLSCPRTMRGISYSGSIYCVQGDNLFQSSPARWPAHKLNEASLIG